MPLFYLNGLPLPAAEVRWLSKGWSRYGGVLIHFRWQLAVFYQPPLLLNIIVVLEWPIQIGIRVICIWIWIPYFEYSKSRVFRVYSNSIIQKIAFFGCIQIRIFRKSHFRIFEFGEHSKPFIYSKKFREHFNTITGSVHSPSATIFAFH